MYEKKHVSSYRQQNKKKTNDDDKLFPLQACTHGTELFQFFISCSRRDLHLVDLFFLFFPLTELYYYYAVDLGQASSAFPLSSALE